MNQQLPFELPKYHKSSRKYNWNRQGMLFTEEGFEYWYNKYIYATNCEICNKEFKNTKDRQLDHNHNNGIVRNIVCNRCNFKRIDTKMYSNNNTGYKNINKKLNKNYKQGFYYQFRINVNGVIKTIKSSTNLEELVKFRDKWYIENNYFT